MKKLLFISLMFLTNLVYGQTYKSFDVSTTVRSTNTMVWNDQAKNWDFFDNEDLEAFEVEWNFVLNLKQNSGTITGNNVTYDVTSIKKQETIDGKFMIVIKATTTRSLTDVTFIITPNERGSIFIGVYDYKARKSYYYN